MAGLLLVFAIVSVIVVPSLSTTGDTTDVEVQPLGTGNVPPGALKDGTVSSNVDGFIIEGQSSGRASIPLQFSARDGQRSILRIWAYGGANLETEVVVVGSDGSRRSLGRPATWVGEAFDVTESVGNGRARVVVSTANESQSPALFFDQATAAVAPESAETDSNSVAVALWVALLIACALQIRHHLARHFLLPAAAAVLVLVVWPTVLDETLTPLGEAASIWEAARSADTFSLHSGLIAGSFGELSSLAVQTYHALTALVGEGAASARAASVLVSVGALCALYALGNRVAGRVGAGTVTAVALLADPFRDAATSGTALPVLIVAAAIFAYGVHICLAEASPYAMGILGACGAVAFLADPTWLFGILLAVLIFPFLYGPHGQRRRAAGVGVLVLLLLILPNRISTADQNQGDLFADTTRRATFARNVEFAQSKPDGPWKKLLAEDPFGGEPVGLASYLLDEHSPIVFVGGALSGANDALGEFGRREDTAVAGLLAFVLCILGSAYLLIVPRLRMLILIPLALAAPSLFFASKEVGTPFAAGAAVWPSFLVGAGVLAYVIRKLAIQRRQRQIPEDFDLSIPPSETPVADSSDRPRRESKPVRAS